MGGFCDPELAVHKPGHPLNLALVALAFPSRVAFEDGGGAGEPVGEPSQGERPRPNDGIAT